MKSYRLYLVTLACALTVAPSAGAQDYSRFDNQYRFYVGGFWADMDSKIGINGDDAISVPPIDVEDVLRVEDGKGVAWGGFEWQIANRHALEAEYFYLNRTGVRSATFSPPLQIGDTFIESGAISTLYDTSVGRITYGYSLAKSERMDLQLLAGLHIAKLEAELQLSGQICRPATVPSLPPGCPTAQTESVAESVTAPLPHIGGSFLYILTPSMAFRFNVIGFALEVNSIEGSIIELNADVAWRPYQNFGVGVGWRFFDVNVKANNSDLNGEFDLTYSGPSIYIDAFF